MSSVLELIVEGILDVAPAHRGALVAIDGIGCSGKTTFAAAVATIDSRPVVLLHADDFFQPAATRHARGRYSPDGFWLDTYNYDALTKWALIPLRAKGSVTYWPAAFDSGTGAVVKPDLVQAPPNPLVIVEGTFLHRDELLGFWDYSIYLDLPLEKSEERMATRTGTADRRLLERYSGAQRIYFAASRPWTHASVVVDNTDFQHPGSSAQAPRQRRGSQSLRPQSIEAAAAR